MPVAAPNFQTLEAALARLGKAWVLVGDPLTSGGLAVLGLTEGGITANMNPEIAQRTYPEHTGPAVWDAKLMGYAPTVEIPLIEGDPAVYAKVSPNAAANGGHTSPQDLTTTTLVLVPELEFADGFHFDAAAVPPAWVSPAVPPEHTVWIPKGYFLGKFPSFIPTNEGVSKGTGSVTFQGMLANSADWPEGTKSWIIGDPEPLGVALSI